MLIFNEGVPRAGKSYDAVVTHILAAIKKRRKVFARLNGLRHALIAEYLGMELEEVDRLLVLISEEQMPFLHTIVEADSLVVIDECHKYYVQSLKPLPTAVETFFAEHGQSGMDILLISQFWKRIHTAVRARVERKTVFQKLSAVGMQGKYLATFYHTTAPDKFEKVGKQTRSYDPKIFPLYDGYKPGSTNTEVYEEGSITVWRTVLPWFALAAVLLLAGGFGYVHFFTSKPKGTAQPDAKPVLTPVAHAAQQTLPSPTGVVLPKVEKPKRPDMPPEVAYVWALNDQARARLAGIVDLGGGKFAGIVEWRADQSRVLDRLTVDQLIALGVMVDRRAYGLKLTWGLGKDKQTIVVTSWPIDEPERYSQQQVQDIRASSPILSTAMPGDAQQAVQQAAQASAGGPARSWGGVGSQSYTPPTYGAWNPEGSGSSRSR